MAKADKPAQRREGIAAQMVKGETDHRGNGLEKSRGNEISATGKNIPQRATVGLDAEKAENLEPRAQGVGGRGK